MVTGKDASLRGWGAVCQGEYTGGCRSLQESKRHISYLELVAVLFAVKALEKQQKAISILIQSDNATTVAYIKHE